MCVSCNSCDAPQLRGSLHALRRLQPHVLLHARGQPPGQELRPVGSRQLGVRKRNRESHQIAHEALRRLRSRHPEKRGLQPHEVHALQDGVVLAVRQRHHGGRHIPLALRRLERVRVPRRAVHRLAKRQQRMHQAGLSFAGAAPARACGGVSVDLVRTARCCAACL